jgi:hypothetical protein
MKHLLAGGLIDQQRNYPVGEACQPCTDVPVWGAPTGSRRLLLAVDAEILAAIENL